MIKYITAAIAAVGLMASVSAADAAALKTGVLSCHVNGGWGLLLGSSHGASCVFTASDGKKTNYTANITKIGVDVGYTDNKNISWIVFNLKGENADLSGTYLGVNAEATAGVGVGANALVGGFNRNFALQPLAVQGQTGLGAALAVQAVTIK